VIAQPLEKLYVPRLDLSPGLQRQDSTA
jgi:hypothetical protein